MDAIHRLNEEDTQQFEMAPMPSDPATAPNIKIQVTEGMSSLTVEGPEPVATHLLHEWYHRMDTSRAANLSAVERITLARANGSGNQQEDEATRM